MTGPTIYPTLQYQDAPAAIDFLKRAFGFEEVVVMPGENGGDGRAIVHAELRYDTGVIMLGSQRRGDDPVAMWSPDQLGGATQSVYMVVADADAHCERARAAGAEIVQEPFDTDHGSRDYSARDPEGHLWFFGTYRVEL